MPPPTCALACSAGEGLGGPPDVSRWVLGALTWAGPTHDGLPGGADSMGIHLKDPCSETAPWYSSSSPQTPQTGSCMQACISLALSSTWLRSTINCLRCGLSIKRLSAADSPKFFKFCKDTLSSSSSLLRKSATESSSSSSFSTGFLVFALRADLIFFSTGPVARLHCFLCFRKRGKEQWGTRQAGQRYLGFSKQITQTAVQQLSDAVVSPRMRSPPASSP